VIAAVRDERETIATTKIWFSRSYTRRSHFGESTGASP
jgi:hypothetical protein